MSMTTDEQLAATCQRLLAVIDGVHLSMVVQPGQRIATCDVIDVCTALPAALRRVAELEKQNEKLMDNLHGTAVELNAAEAKLAAIEAVCKATSGEAGGNGFTMGNARAEFAN